ncbi:OTU-like cysteine protease [Plectosphaerella cucumerina]|uniref:Ubiquitin thioesterase OTU n=1 Tax=Plectosphaerella cucumerina TaxID=40658 RepID=A0A8K0TW16_9PEZI|nr:OTU-like cysteine protease [Plectosphaerella cucumerina]
MRARYKGPAGTGVLSLEDDATVGQLFDLIREQSGISAFTLKYGWPLKTLDQSQKGDIAKSLGLNGETFTIVPDEASLPPPAPAPTAASSSSAKPGPPAASSSMWGDPSPPRQGPESVSLPWPERNGTLLLRVMPDDNSCLFTAFGGVLPDQPTAATMRKLVADHILAHPDVYTEVVLAAPPHEYARKIQGKDRWGGAIELSIFSEIYDMEIVTIDVKQQRAYYLGENKKQRCILVYSGIHYDRVGLSPTEPPHTSSDLPPEVDQTSWATDDQAVVNRALELAAILNKMHYYTDPAEILLRCNAFGCEWIGSGERAGALHAQSTGHTDLEEIKDDQLLRCNTPGCDWLGTGEKAAKQHKSDSGHTSLSEIKDS